MATTKKNIYYTGSCDFVIPVYFEKSKNDITGNNRIKSSVLIKGGVGVSFSDDDKVRKSQTSVLTVVSGADYDLIKENPAFKRKLAAGFIKVGDAPTESKLDKSAQLNEAQIKAKNKSIKASTDAID